MFKQTPGAPQPFIGKHLKMSASWWHFSFVKLWQYYLSRKGCQHSGHYRGCLCLMSAKNACSQNQMGIRWPPLFWADLSLKRVNRQQTFLWSQPASYLIGQSKMWSSNINGRLHRLHCICSHFISSSLCGENVIPRLQFVGIINYYIAPIVGIFTPFVNKNRVKKTDWLYSKKNKKNNRTHSSNIRNVFPLLSGLCVSWEKRNIHAG